MRRGEAVRRTERMRRMAVFMVNGSRGVSSGDHVCVTLKERGWLLKGVMIDLKEGGVALHVKMG